MSSPPRLYPADLSDAECVLLAPLIPPPKPGGRPLTWTRRAILDGIVYVVRSGCQWRQPPREYPPHKTVYHFFRLWRLDGTWPRLNTTLRAMERQRQERDPQPSGCIYPCAPGQEPPPRPRFTVLPRRWVVERTFAWLAQSRRLSKDYERLPQTSEAMLRMGKFWDRSGLSRRAGTPASSDSGTDLLAPSGISDMRPRWCDASWNLALTSWLSRSKQLSSQA